MTNKRISFEQKIEELLEKGSNIEFKKVESTNKYTVSVEFTDCKDTSISNDLSRALTNIYNTYN